MKRTAMGFLMISLSVILIAIYTYLLFFAPARIQVLTLKLTVYITVVVFLIASAVMGFLYLKTATMEPEELEKYNDSKCSG